MAHLRQKGNRYYAEFYDPDRQPKRKWIALRTTDKRGATHALTDLDRRHMAGLFDPWEDPAPRKGMTLDEAIDGFLQSRRSQSPKPIRPKTLRADRSTLRLLESELPAGILVGQISSKMVDRFLDRPSLSMLTVTTYHARLNRFFSWCADQGAIKTHPMAKRKRPKAQKKVAEFLNRSDYEALLATIDSDADERLGTIKPGEIRWLADVIRVAVGTGLRLGELCNLRWSAVNLDTGFLTVRASDGFETKSGHERSVYVTGEALAVLTRLRAGAQGDYVFVGTGGDKLDPVYVSKRFRRYADRAGLSKKIHFHSLRHTYASWLVMGGTDLFRVKELLGHADISTTMRYAHLRPQSFKADVERVFGDGTSAGRIEEQVNVYRLAS